MLYKAVIILVIAFALAAGSLPLAAQTEAAKAQPEAAKAQTEAAKASLKACLPCWSRPTRRTPPRTT